MKGLIRKDLLKLVNKPTLATTNNLPIKKASVYYWGFPF
tara:strand:+ start:364 stop:480 length:117 start_codon:yes stop_codon:yes gene_type:complete